MRHAERRGGAPGGGPIRERPLRDLEMSDVLVTVPTAGSVQVRALRDDEVLPGWRSGVQIIDYGVVESWYLPAAGERQPHDDPPPPQADALRIVAYGEDLRARGFELTIP